MSGLDTTGCICVNGTVYSWDGDPAKCVARSIPLNPFTQGYVEALMEELYRRSTKVQFEGAEPGFSDLAPETLARIMEDCAAFQASRAYEPMRALAGPAWAQSHHNAGQTFWIARNNGETDFTFTLRTGRGQDWPDFSAEPMNRLAKSFPPLTPYLGDGGKVYLRDAPSPSSDRGGS